MALPEKGQSGRTSNLVLKKYQKILAFEF